MKNHNGKARKSHSRVQAHEEGSHLDSLLAHDTQNPFVKMVRWFFFYTDDHAHPVAH